MKKSLLLFLVLCTIGAAVGCSGKKGNPALNPRRDLSEAETLMREGVIYLNNNRLNEAEQRLKAALQIDPNMQHAMNALGIVYTYKQEFVKAKEIYERLLSINPYYWDAINAMGIIYMQLGENDKAREYLITAANSKENLTPENAYINLAILDIREDRFESALRYAEKGLGLNEQCFPLLILKGKSLENMSRYDQALESFEKAYKLIENPQPAQLIDLALTFKKFGDKTKALDLLEKALGISKDPTEKEAIMKRIKEIQDR